MRRFLFVLPLLWSSSALACLNDRDSDSLALQAQNFPDTLRVITGRFERNPPLYYEMRVQRSLAELKKSPRNFGLYDDIGVALDRLHKSDEALQIMAKKRALLPPFDAKNPAMKEAWYRYYANAGTFRAHRFLGAKTQDIGEMKKARDYIKRAMEIKPNAHFGREKYQLMAMEWILAVKTKKTDKSLGMFLERRDQWEGWESAKKPATRRDRAVEGLSGLVVLGAAWQSTDVFEALSHSLETKDGVTLRHLALRRCEEILKNGGRSLAPKTLNAERISSAVKYAGINDYGIGVNDQNQKILDELFPKLRAEADVWSGQRTDYMLSRLQKGQHPDIHPTFWNEWKPAAPPSLDMNWANERKRSRDMMNVIGITVWVLSLTGLVFVGWLVKRLFKRRRLAA